MKVKRKKKSKRLKDSSVAKPNSSFAAKVAPMSWDEKHQLTKDILLVAPADLPGLLLTIYNETPLQFYSIPHPTKSHVTTLDLETLPNHALWRLRSYVDQSSRQSSTVSFATRSECSVCAGLWCPPTEKLYRCGNDSCTTAIHESCFGLIWNKDPWYCPSCESGAVMSCFACGKEGGALKRTEDGRWMHVLCCLVIPETTMRDVPTLEPVDGISEIDAIRWRWTCGICRSKTGICVTCDFDNCNRAFHPQCAADTGHLVGSQKNFMAIFCDAHMPKERIVPGARRWVSEEDCLGLISPAYMTSDSEYAFLNHALISDSLDLSSSRAITTIGAKVPEERIISTTVGLAVNNVPTIRGLNVGGYVPSNRLQIKTTYPAQTPFMAATEVLANNVLPGLSSQCPAFPTGKELIGAIVDVFLKDSNAWYRAELLDFSSRNRNHMVRCLDGSLTVWMRIRSHNARILRLRRDQEGEHKLRISLIKSSDKEGRSIWVPKPKKFYGSGVSPRVR